MALINVPNTKTKQAKKGKKSCKSNIRNSGELSKYVLPGIQA